MCWQVTGFSSIDPAKGALRSAAETTKPASVATSVAGAGAGTGAGSAGGGAVAEEQPLEINQRQFLMFLTLVSLRIYCSDHAADSHDAVSGCLMWLM